MISIQLDPHSFILLTLLIFNSTSLFAIQRPSLGFELGELPIQGSFKPGLNLTYHLDNKNGITFSYQIKDTLARDQDSFNAKSIGFDGLLSSTEYVANRAQVLGLRYVSGTPIYLTYGFVYNGRDTEKMRFDSRNRNIQKQNVTGPVSITISRRASLSPVLGLGLQWQLGIQSQAFIQWSGNLLNQAPTPVIEISSKSMTRESHDYLTQKIEQKYSHKITNVYHVFSMGMRF